MEICSRLRCKALLVGAVSLIAGASGAGCTSPTQAAADWVAAHPNEWVLDIDDRQSGHTMKRPSWSGGCGGGPAVIGTSQVMPAPGTSPSTVVLRYATSETSVDFFFRCPIQAPVTAEVLNATFSHAVLDQLPHGIAVSNWQFKILTPSSSFSKGVTFMAVGDGRLKAQIRTELYSIRGTSKQPECKAPADGSMRPECFVSREHRIPLILTMEVPFDPGALQ
jgi:hypothetical protein